MEVLDILHYILRSTTQVEYSEQEEDSRLVCFHNMAARHLEWTLYPAVEGLIRLHRVPRGQLAQLALLKLNQ